MIIISPKSLHQHNIFQFSTRKIKKKWEKRIKLKIRYIKAIKKMKHEWRHGEGSKYDAQTGRKFIKNNKFSSSRENSFQKIKRPYFALAFFSRKMIIMGKTNSREWQDNKKKELHRVDENSASACRSKESSAKWNLSCFHGFTEFSWLCCEKNGFWVIKCLFVKHVELQSDAELGRDGKSFKHMLNSEHTSPTAYANLLFVSK